MLSTSTFRSWALALAGAEEVPHFDKPSFRYKGKIFATLWEEENKAMLKLPPELQAQFCERDPDAFSPVPGAWGKQGATFVLLANADAGIFQEALNAAYNALVQSSASKKRNDRR